MLKLMNKNDNIAIDKLSKKLRGILREKDEVEQCLAVQALGKLSDSASLDILLEHLHNPDEDVRCDVGNALCNIIDERAIDPLISNLIEDPVGEAKLVYVNALRAQGAIKAADILCSLVKGRDEKNIAWEEDGFDWDDWLDVQIAAINALGDFAPNIDKQKAISAIVGAINDDDGQDLWSIGTKNLIKFGHEGSAALLELMKQASDLDRKKIMIALADANDELSENIIKAGLKDPDKKVRIEAIKSGAKRNLTEIISLAIDDANADVRATILQNFSQIDEEILLKGLNDISPKVQNAACKAIIRDKKNHKKLNLIKRAQSLLRKDEDELLSNLIHAIAIIKPQGASEFIEDIVNHSATKKEVRLVALKALGELNSANSVTLLRDACADNLQEIRLCAIDALGKIARGEGENSKEALAIISSAIMGELIAAPKDWQPENDNIVDFEEKKSKGDNLDEDERKIRLDREGNIIEIEEDRQNQDEPEEEDNPQQLNPQSTLDAIMAANIKVPTKEENIKIDEEDIEYLQMSAVQGIKRKRVSPQSKVPAHIDVRRLAALVGGQIEKEELLPAYIKALDENDKQLIGASLDALLCLAKNKIDIVPAQKLILRHATGGDGDVNYKAIRLLAFIKNSLVDKVIAKLCNDENDMVRAEAIRAAKGRNLDIDFVDLCQNSQRTSRAAAAEAVCELDSEKAVSALFAFSLVEDGVHKQQAAKLLNNHFQAAIDRIAELLGSERKQVRIIMLELLNLMLGSRA